MHAKTVLAVFFMAASTAFSLPGFAQSPSASSDAGGGAQASGGKTASNKQGDASVDCPKEMANAREARQAGHITDKEYVEQKKMAETKLKRDSAQPRLAEKNVGCP